MSEIQLKIVLNKGRHGILMSKLAQIAEEAEKFLASFSDDLNLSKNEWVADNFRNGSLTFTINYVGTAEHKQISKARKALTKIIDPKTTPSELNGDLSRKTYIQFAKIATPIDADDVIGLAVNNEKGRFVTKSFSKERARLIEREINSVTEEFAGFQGSVIALFNEGTFWLADCITHKRVVCHYKPQHYKIIWKLLGKQDALANVEGWLIKKADTEYLKIEHISELPEYREGDIEKFFGSAPSFTGNKTTGEYLSEMRDEFANS